jgi:queuine/archaeosine tRNA-ribosyltransferase
MTGEQSGRTTPHDLTFFFGAASGSSRKALQKLDEPNVMLNYATKNNIPWPCERLFIDSGGYSFMKGKGEYTTTNSEYLHFIEDHQPEIFALRDYPCEPEVLDEHGRTVRDHQRRTTKRHRDLLDHLDNCEVDGQPLAVLQGWEPDDYLRHLDALRDAGCLTEYVGIGSVCRRNREAEIREVILSVREALPQKYDLHAFGVKGSVLQFADVRAGLASADSQSYEMQAQWGTLRDLGAGNKTWRDSAFEYLKQKRRIRALLGSDESPDSVQSRLPEVENGAE